MQNPTALGGPAQTDKEYAHVRNVVIVAPIHNSVCTACTVVAMQMVEETFSCLSSEKKLHILRGEPVHGDIIIVDRAIDHVRLLLL